ncbi:MAG: hypothetical protein ACFCUR_07070 [Rhodomicrobiaceae bacterium]
MAGIIEFAIAVAGVVVGAVLLDLIRDQAKASTPWLADWLRQQAVKRLPESMREQADEEWRAWLEETPGPLAKLWHAIGFLIFTFRVPPSPQKQSRAEQKEPAFFRIFRKIDKIDNVIVKLMFRINAITYPHVDRKNLPMFRLLLCVLMMSRNMRRLAIADYVIIKTQNSRYNPQDPT